MRIYTCTPMDFSGSTQFFSRDSGLLSRGLQTLGIDSRTVMIGNPRADDAPDLLRTDLANLKSSAWWRAQQLDAVVLYAWGRPRFRQVAAAIHAAGIFLVLNQDNSGVISPLVGIRPWLREQWRLSGQGRTPRAWSHFLKLTLRGLTAGLFLTDPLRAAHLRHGDVIACVSPLAAARYRKLCRIYGGAKLAARVAVLPHAVEPNFTYGGSTKRRQVVCVGRWHDIAQKRPWLLIEVITALVQSDPDVSVVIAGTATPELLEWQRSLSLTNQARVTLRGQLARQELAALLGESQVFYSPSAYESFGIAAGEALCAGCSVVAARSDSLPGFAWFVADQAGVLAEADHASGHLHALQHELQAWQLGQRNPEHIANLWGRRLHAPQVAAEVISMKKESKV